MTTTQQPQQQQPQQPPKKHHRLRNLLLFVVGPLVTVIVLIIALTTALSNSVNKAANPVSRAPSTSAPAPNSPASTPSSTPTPSGPEQLTLGQSASFTDNSSGATLGSITITATTTTKPADPSYGEPPANGYFVIVKVTAKADPGYTEGFNLNEMDFTALVKGQQYQWSDGNSMYALNDTQQNQDITTNPALGAGQSRTGYMAFDVPASHGQIVYSPNLNGQPLAEWAF